MSGIATQALLDKLLSFLEREARKPLESLVTSFKADFPVGEHFSALTTLSLFVETEDLLPETSLRIAALYLLYDLHSSKPLADHPYYPVFHEILKERSDSSYSLDAFPSISPLKRLLLFIFASSPDLGKQSAQGFVTGENRVEANGLLPSVFSPLPPIPSFPLTTKFSNAALCGLIPDPDDPFRASSSSLPFPSSDASHPSSILANHRLDDLHFMPSLLSIPPPLLDADEQEMLWLTPFAFPHSLLWDPSVAANPYTDGEAKLLLTKACKSSLTNSQLQFLLAELKKNKKLVLLSGITPQRIPQLVESNPLVAVEVLSTAMTFPNALEYLNILTQMELSLHSLEVVNRLTAVCPVPKPFLNDFVDSCLRCCSNTEDKLQQNRWVRLVSVFLQSLIRNKQINVQEKFVEIQTFAIEFSRIREALSLFRLLKSLEHTPPAS